VKEFMVLPEDKEQLLEQQLEVFMGTTTKPYMKVSERTKRFTERIYAAAHDGKLPSEMIEEERRRAEEERRRTEEERQRAEYAALQLEEERQRAEEERQRTEEERQRLEEAVVRLYTQFAMPVKQVAEAMGMSIETVEDILRRYGQN
jgi:chromosome segregation ATPase